MLEERDSLGLLLRYRLTIFLSYGIFRTAKTDVA